MSHSQPPNFAAHLAHSKPLVPKKHPITNDYTILTKSLGVGVNGKVLQCIHKATGATRALKVSSNDEGLNLLVTACCGGFVKGLGISGQGNDVAG